ncbi:MAG: DUF1189 family protein [Chitinispirillia bacterium]|nr:DUF1189 family protein [Chitinispirillia bacterium]
MKFFSSLHKSIFDPAFSKEAVKLPAGRCIMFLLKLLVLTALISGLAKTYYLLHPERGAASVISAMFNGIEIRDGRLETEREVPFEMPKDLTGALLDDFVGFKVFEQVPDNFLVVDTRNPIPAGDEMTGAAKVVLRDTSVFFKDMRIEVPYRLLVGKNFEFTEPAVQRVLQKNVLSFVLNFFMFSFVFTLFTVLMSVFFLSAAAYLFSFQRTKKFVYFLKIACFSISPVMIGSALVAVSGVRAEWAWYIFVILSTMIMFRAMAHASIDAPVPDDKINNGIN